MKVALVRRCRDNLGKVIPNRWYLHHGTLREVRDLHLGYAHASALLDGDSDDFIGWSIHSVVIEPNMYPNIKEHTGLYPIGPYQKALQHVNEKNGTHYTALFGHQGLLDTSIFCEHMRPVEKR